MFRIRQKHLKLDLKFNLLVDSSIISSSQKLGKLFLHYERIKHLWEDIIKHGVSAATTEYCEWIQVGIDDQVGPEHKYQVKPS